MRVVVPVLLLCLAAIAVGGERSREPNPVLGAVVFRGLGCAQCHALDGVPGPRGTRRAGIVLDGGRPFRARVWHRAHLFAPRAVSAESTMPAFSRFFSADPREESVRRFVEEYDTRDGGMFADGVVTREEFVSAGGPDWERVLREFDSGDGVISLADVVPRPSPAVEYLIDLARSRARDAPEPMGDPPDRAESDPASAVRRGEALFRLHCAGCHGERADGNGPAARFFGDAPPRNLLRGDFKFRSTLPPRAPADADVYRTIRFGAGGSMPPWPRLSDRQVWDLVEFVKSNHPAYLPRELIIETADGEEVARFTRESEDASGIDLDEASLRVRKRAGRWWIGGREIEEGARIGAYRFRYGRAVFDWLAGYDPEPVPLPEPEIAFTRVSVVLGYHVYVELDCARCHGAEGRGDGAAAEQTRGSLGEIVRPRDYTRGPQHFKGGADPRSLVRRFLTGIEGTPMPSFREALAGVERVDPREAPWHLAHYVLYLAGVPVPR